ncbi:MAG TPA: hypothetical protein DC054_03045 [Blastocatellia bacterium]|nr:hypothetical protein [Blastocatellia bacterium]
MSRRTVIVRVTLVVLCVALFYQPSEAQRNLRINGTVVGISGRLAGRTLPFSLFVNRYTTPGEITELNGARGRGEDSLLSTLSHMNVGRIQIGNNVGVTANAIIATPWGDGGTKLTVLWERNINFYELRYGTRSEDYRFGYAEMFLDQNGKGEGTFIPAARVNLRNGNTWEVEDFGVLPARLMGLRASGTVQVK